VDIAADTNVTERDFSELEEHRWAEAGLKTVRCDNCGATETVKGDEIATVCPFCSSPLVLEEHCFDGVKPDSLIPFSLDRQKGLEACKKWLKKRFFAPSKFKKNINVNTIRGVYYPVWTFDSTTDTVYAGRLGKTYTTTRRDSKGNTHTEVKVRYFNVSGTRRNYFDDVTVNGGAFVSDKNRVQVAAFSAEQIRGLFFGVSCGFFCKQLHRRPVYGVQNGGGQDARNNQTSDYCVLQRRRSGLSQHEHEPCRKIVQIYAHARLHNRNEIP